LVICLAFSAALATESYLTTLSSLPSTRRLLVIYKKKNRAPSLPFIFKLTPYLRLFRNVHMLGALEILGTGVLIVRQARNFRWNNGDGRLSKGKKSLYSM